MINTDTGFYTFCLEKLGEALYLHSHNLNKIDKALEAVDYLNENGVFTNNTQESVKNV